MMEARERNKVYYRQHPSGTGFGLRPATTSVGELIDQLAALPRDLPVIIRSPQYGAFGSGTCYAVDGAYRQTLAASTTHHPESAWFDEESGEEVPQEAWSEERPAWDGVVIA